MQWLEAQPVSEAAWVRLPPLLPLGTRERAVLTGVLLGGAAVMPACISEGQPEGDMVDRRKVCRVVLGMQSVLNTQ